MGGGSNGAGAMSVSVRPKNDGAWVRVVIRVVLIISVALSISFWLAPYWQDTVWLDQVFHDELATVNTLLLIIFLLFVFTLVDSVALGLSVALLREPRRWPYVISAVIAIAAVVAPLIQLGISFATSRTP
jgi:hypothetical protein